MPAGISAAVRAAEFLLSARFFLFFFLSLPSHSLCASVLVGRTRDGQPLVAFSVQPRRGREGRRARTHAPAKQVWFVVYTCTHTHTLAHTHAPAKQVWFVVYTHTHTLRASLSGTFLQTLPDLVTPLYLRTAVQRRGQRPPKGSGTSMTVEAT